MSGLTSGVTAIAAGGDHTCALTSGGGVKCWGHNFYGQLGDGEVGHHTTPVQVRWTTASKIPTSGGQLHGFGATFNFPAGTFAETVVVTHTVLSERIFRRCLSPGKRRHPLQPDSHIQQQRSACSTCARSNL